ncbi:hypothetical protein GCM10018777_07950 [Streptomyces albogriseolus]|nr:hypothetical protein GCM10018777_07950 [Streptomyces viridodiastaticus]
MCNRAGSGDRPDGTDVVGDPAVLVRGLGQALETVQPVGGAGGPVVDCDDVFEEQGPAGEAPGQDPMRSVTSPWHTAGEARHRFEPPAATL